MASYSPVLFNQDFLLHRYQFNGVKSEKIKRKSDKINGNTARVISDDDIVNISTQSITGISVLILLNTDEIKKARVLLNDTYIRLVKRSDESYHLYINNRLLGGIRYFHFDGRGGRGPPLYIDIPEFPSEDDESLSMETVECLLTTTHLQGCSVIVTCLDEDTYRVYHDPGNPVITNGFDTGWSTYW